MRKVGLRGIYCIGSIADQDIQRGQLVVEVRAMIALRGMNKQGFFSIIDVLLLLTWAQSTLHTQLDYGQPS